MPAKKESKAEFPDQWESKTPEERRARLDELAAHYPNLDEDGVREHDTLAVTVAKDEDKAAQEPQE